MQKALDDTAKEVIRDFKVTTSTWNHKPEFEVLGSRARVGVRSTTITIGTHDPIYNMLMRRTKPHLITGKLVFNSEFAPKSRPNILRQNAGHSGGQKVFAESVHHPGTEARNYDIKIADKHRRRNTLGNNIMKQWTKVI